MTRKIFRPENTALVIPSDYKPKLTLVETEDAIDRIKQVFTRRLLEDLKLRRLTGPLFLEKGTGINDDLSGIEGKAGFVISTLDVYVEMLNSLAKYKRLACKEHNIPVGHGIWIDMNAIRKDEAVLDNYHSVYVDQFDWEMVIRQCDRNLEFLESIVNRIYNAVLVTAEDISRVYERQGISPNLPQRIEFVHSEELAKLWPKKTPKEREAEIVLSQRAVFIIGIGANLPGTNAPHDARAPDYDDWVTKTERGRGLNGDIFIWDSVLHQPLELSSMGIRVSPETLMKQLKLLGNEDRERLLYHRLLLEGKLPQTIGGGIGQSRLCMLLLQKAHIGEVQSSVWPKEDLRVLAEHGIPLIGAFRNLEEL